MEVAAGEENRTTSAFADKYGFLPEMGHGGGDKRDCVNAAGADFPGGTIHTATAGQRRQDVIISCSC